MLPRSKLVRDPGSFGYRRLLPFLNEMAKNGNALSNPNSQQIYLLIVVRFPLLVQLFLCHLLARAYVFAWFRQLHRQI